MINFRKGYFFLAILIFLIEVVIAVYVQDAFLRPYGGDFLVVIFLYFLLKSFFDIPVKNAIFGVLLFAFVIEGLQFFNFIELLGLEDNKIASVVMGSHFEWLDMALYALGGLAVYLVELKRRGFSKNRETEDAEKSYK